MIHRINKGLIMFVIIVLILNLSIPLTISKTATINPKDEYKNYTDISFDKSYRTDYSESMYDLKNETMMNHSFFNSIDNNESNSFDNITGESISNRTVIVYSDDDALMDSCWPMKSQNRRHTGLSPYNSENNNGMVKWVYEGDDWLEGGIVIDEDGVLYFGDFGYRLYAMYPNGTLKWRFKTDGQIWSTPALSSDGTIYIGTYGDSLYAIHSDGTLKWKTSCNGSISSSPAISKDGIICFGTMGWVEDGDCLIICLNPDGTKKWEYPTGYKIVSDPAIGDDGTIYIGSGDSYLYALNPDGTLKWRFKTGDFVKSHPTIDEDGTIYFDSFDGYFYALNPDGTLKWKYNGVGTGSGGVAIDNQGMIYIGGDSLSVFYPTGELKWQYYFGDGKYTGQSSPAISSDGTIYIGLNKGEMSSGHIYAINDDGTLKWKKKISNRRCASSPTIDSDGNVYIGSSSDSDIWGYYGELYAFGRNEENQAPEPPKISGYNRGQVNTSYTFNFTVHDPELDDIELLVDWGDGTDTGWIGPYDSNEDISLSHKWTEKGTFELRAKARDTYDGSESDWSTLSVTMPKTRSHVIFFHLWEQLLQHFPNISLLFNE